MQIDDPTMILRFWCDINWFLEEVNFNVTYSIYKGFDAQNKKTEINCWSTHFGIENLISFFSINFWMKL